MKLSIVELHSDKQLLCLTKISSKNVIMAMYFSNTYSPLSPSLTPSLFLPPSLSLPLSLSLSLSLSRWVESNHLFVCGSYVYNHYVDCEDTDYYLSSDKINSVVCQPLEHTDTPSPVLACQDYALRVLKVRTFSPLALIFVTISRALIFIMSWKLLELHRSLLSMERVLVSVLLFTVSLCVCVVSG